MEKDGINRPEMPPRRPCLMNDFFNYKKRDVELPPGCKDLIDVLHLGHSTEMSPSEPGVPSVEIIQSVPAKTLTDLGGYLDRFVSSKAASKALWINCNFTSTVAFFDGKHGLRSIVLVEVSRAQAVRDLFGRAGHTPIHDNDLENNTRGLQFILASKVGFEPFVRDLLTLGCGVTPDSPLEFHFNEKPAT
jgi:hypothetical protein